MAKNVDRREEDEVVTVESPPAFPGEGRRTTTFSVEGLMVGTQGVRASSGAEKIVDETDKRTNKIKAILPSEITAQYIEAERNL